MWKAWGADGHYVPRGHNDLFDVHAHRGEQVVFVDISLRNKNLRALADVADRVVVLDHHLSARDHYRSDPSIEDRMRSKDHHIHFDLEHSGAVLAWQHFHPDQDVPDLLAYVEDQDLWSWKLPRSEEVNAAIGSYAREFPIWEDLSQRLPESLAIEGEPILRAQRIEVEHSLQFAHPVTLGSLRAEAVNALYLRSAIGHELAKRKAFGQPIGLVYRFTSTRVDISIYSIGEVDVSEIAREHGGGGHRNASGFSVPLERWLADFV